MLDLRDLRRKRRIRHRHATPAYVVNASQRNSMMLHAVQNSVIEWSYASTKVYEDPFHDLEMDVVFTDPVGVKRKVPAFWAGEQNMKSCKS